MLLHHCNQKRSPSKLHRYEILSKILKQWRRIFFDLDHFSSARPNTEHTANKITLKESAELVLHSSVSQQPTSHSPDLSHTSSANLQASLVEQVVATLVLPSASPHVLIQESSPSAHVFSFSSLWSANVSFEQSSSVPLHTQHLRP